MLCKYCSNLNLIQAASQAGAQHHRAYSNLLASADNGCELCAAILGSRETFGSTVGVGEIVCHFSATESVLSWTCENAEGSLRGNVAQLQVCVTKDDPLASVVSARPIAPDAASEQLYEAVEAWMVECQLYHPECTSRSRSRLPSRVIDVATDGLDPFLFLSQHQPGQWVTLSHCWGHETPPRTTHANVEERCRKIRLKDLPLLFQDAVQITRRLGFQYLWIDALCIIQDSVDDWRSESIEMGDIYAGAQLTIAAEACFNCKEGILHTANKQRPQESTKTSIQAFQEELYGTLIIDTRTTQHAQQSRGPLSTRLWTLQENLLSRRTLLFAEEQVWWQCREMQRNERHPHWEAPRIHVESLATQSMSEAQWDTQNEFPLTSASSRIKGMSLKRQNLYFQPLQCWYRTVNAFCSRRATYRSDIFPAISGIAREYYRHIRQDYKAGLWEEDIHVGLVWSVPHPHGTRGEDYIAPSFSWASFDFATLGRNSTPSQNQVYDPGLIDQRLGRPKANIISTRIQNVTSDPFGQVKGGSLLLEAPCTDVCSCMIQPSFFDCRTHGQYPCLNRTLSLNAGKPWLGTPGRDEYTVDYHIKNACHSDPKLLHNNHLYIHILSFDNSKGLICTFALILTKTAGDGDTYERVGLAILEETVDTSLIWPSRTITII